MRRRCLPCYHLILLGAISAVLGAGTLASCQRTTPATLEKAPEVTIARSTLPDPTTFPLGAVQATYDRAVLSEIETDFGPLRILRVAGSPYEMGYQYGRLMGGQILETWYSLMASMGSEVGVNAEQADRILGPLLDRAYDYMRPYVPSQFDEEMQGISDGAQDTGVTYRGPGNIDMKTLLERVIALSNVSDLNAFDEGAEAVVRILVRGASAELDQFFDDQALRPGGHRRGTATPRFPLLGGTCSFFAAWGPRTEDGRLFGSRNLDWSTDTGISNSALVTIYAPENGLVHATFGFAGIIGALAGINENGIVVSEVGSNSVLEKLKGEPWTLKFREILTSATDMEEAVSYMVNQAADHRNRPTTLGYNFMIGFGDPGGRGSKAQAAVLEANGGLTFASQRSSADQYNSCSETPRLYTYGHDGRVVRLDELGTSSEVNLEASAKEIDADAFMRTFKVEDGSFVRDEDGYLIEDPLGQPIQTGLYLNCALYRGDEALGYGTRRWQTAANGPSGDDPREVLIDSGSWKERYAVMYGILEALWNGTQYDAGGTAWVEPGAPMRVVGMEEANDIARASAMSSNIMSVVYDATDLAVRVAFESGTGATWTSAAGHTYAELDLVPLFNWD